MVGIADCDTPEFFLCTRSDSAMKIVNRSNRMIPFML